MNSQQVDEIISLFRSKAPADHYTDSCQISHNNIKYGGVHLFNGTNPDSQKVASLCIKGITADVMSVELIVGNDSFEVLDSVPVLINLINVLVPFQGYKKIKHEQAKKQRLTKKLFLLYYPHWAKMTRRDPIQYNLAYNEWKRERQKHL